MLRRFRAGVPGALLVLLTMLCGCTGMVEDELAETHAKLKALQELVASVNKDLTTLDLIVSKLDDSHTIEPGSLKETEDGYEISFRDGKKIFIPYGKDGKDGRTLIPVGVRSDEDSLYYWTVDGEWYLDAEGNKMRAGATDGVDGVDGIVPQIKVEDGFWWISYDEGQNFDKLVSCEDMDGVGVFSGVDTSDSTKMVLKLLDGTSIDIPRLTSLKVSFAGPVMDTVLIAAGELLPIPYEVSVEGADAGSLIVTAGTDGVYSSRLVEGSEPGKGVALVQAPAVFSEGYILLSAVCDGYSAIKMISFKERQITPAADTVTVRMSSGSDTVKVAFSANFEFTVSWSEEWLKMAQDTVSRDTLIFISTPNTSDTIRTCTVKVSPKDNPNFVCKTFVVMQATETGNTASYDLDKDSAENGFSLVVTDLDRMTLYAPAAGGEAVIWINSNKEVVKESRDLDWFTADLSSGGSFYHKLVVNVLANESESRRVTVSGGTDTDERIKVSVGKTMVEIAVIQEGKPSESTGE